MPTRISCIKQIGATCIVLIVPTMYPSSWDELRKAARHLENEIDLKLVSLSKVGLNVPGSSSHSDTAPLLGENVFDTLAAEIEQMLDKLSTINDKFSDLNLSGTASTHTLQRHRDILYGYQQEFNKIQANHSTRLEREELLRGSGISSNNSGMGATLNRRDTYLKEMTHLHNSHNLINDQLEIAIETREHLNSQRQYLKRVQTRFNDMTNRFPLINSLVQRIHIKKRRDSLIVGGTIGICIFLVLIYAFN